MSFFKVISINISTTFHMQMDKSGSVYEIGGSDFYLLKVLADHFPFRYELLNRADYDYGQINKDGEWTGMIGMLKKGEADMAIGWVASTSTRLQAVDFSFPYLIDSAVFCTAAPGLKKREFPFLDPFQIMVWYFLLLSLPISAAVIHILSSCKIHKEGFLRGWVQETYNLLAHFLSQGSYGSYRKVAVQIFMYHWTLSKLVLVFSYSCTLLAFLMVPQRESPLNDIRELGDAVVSGKYQFGAFKRTAVFGNLREAKSGVMKDLADHIRSHPENALHDTKHTISRVESEKFATLVLRMHFIVTISSIGIRRFHISSDNFGFLPVCIAFRKGFVGMERINRLLHRITESGIYAQQVEGEIYRSQLKAPPEAPVENERSLAFTDMQTSFYLLFSGHLASTCCLLLEICFYNYQARIKNFLGLS